MINHLVAVAVFLTSLAAHALAEPPEEKPRSYDGIIASLKLEKTEHKGGEPLDVTITITCARGPHRLFNPYFNGLVPLPGWIVVRNSRGEVMKKLLEFQMGSQRGVSEVDYVQVQGEGFVGTTKRVYPEGWHGKNLAPGDYTLQLELTETLLDETFLRRMPKKYDKAAVPSLPKVIVTSAPIAYRIVE